MTNDSSSIAIRLNGEARRVVGGLTIDGLLKELAKDPRVVAIELNGDILPRGDFGQTSLTDGDSVEVVQFVQGG